MVLAHHRLCRRTAGRHRTSWKAAGRIACSPCSATGSAAREGAEVDFTLEKSGDKIRVFTTRIDTIYGATCVILAPGHPLVAQLASDELKPRVKAMIDAQAAKIPATSKKKVSSPATTRSTRSAERRSPSGSATSS